MKQLINLVCMIAVTVLANAQSVQQRLQKAWTAFEKDEQLKYAISSLYVIDAKTGGVVFDKNSRVGLSPASTQKVITSATAFELLGKDYRYATDFILIREEEVNTLVIDATGDPVLGSWRFPHQTKNKVLERLNASLIKTNITLDKVKINQARFQQPDIPAGWIWQDLANYYGAPAMAFNWGENQSDIFLTSDNRIGGQVIVAGNELPYKIKSAVKAAEKGTGDNAFAYFQNGEEGLQLLITGTIPRSEKNFKISVTDPLPQRSFLAELYQSYPGLFNRAAFRPDKLNPEPILQFEGRVVHTEYSPTLDSVIYWFNKKSVNLYGEALLKTMAFQKKAIATTDSGIAVVKDFWKTKGLDINELNIYDGSGLSPLNRITTHAQVEVLKYARSKNWFPLFKNALPEYNNMTMKSGTISDVKGFCGYHTSKSGREYIFSFLVNNYSGKTSPVVLKMYRVLDELK